MGPRFAALAASAWILFAPPFSHAKSKLSKKAQREQATAVRDARSHLPKMQRVVCLLEKKCAFPAPQEFEMDIVQAGVRLLNASKQEEGPLGVTMDIPLPRELSYISPGNGVRARALAGELVEVVFFREPLSRRGVVVYGDKPSETLNNPSDLQPKWRFGYLQN